MRPHSVEWDTLRLKTVDVGGPVELLAANGTDAHGDPVTVYTARERANELRHWDTDPAVVVHVRSWGRCRSCPTLLPDTRTRCEACARKVVQRAA